MAKGNDGLHQHQRALKVHLENFGKAPEYVARVAGVSLHVAKTAMGNYAAGHYVIPVIDGVENYALAYKTGSIYPSDTPESKKMYKRMARTKRKDEAAKQTDEQLFPSNELEQYLEEIEGDDHSTMTWYAAGVVTGCILTLVTAWLASQIA